MKVFSPSDSITKQEILFYGERVGTTWDKDNDEQKRDKDAILLLWDKLKLIGELFTRKALSENFHVCGRRSCLDQATKKKFRDYVLVKIKHNTHTFKDEFYYWLGAGFEREAIFDAKTFIKSKFRITLGLGIRHENVPMKIKTRFHPPMLIGSGNQEDILPPGVEHLLNRCFVSDVGNKTLEEIASCLIEQSAKYEKSFDQLISEHTALLQELKSLKATDQNDEDSEEDSDEESSNIQEHEDTSNTSEMGESLVKAHNTIYYGPPGTGKTFRLQNLKAKYSDRCAFVTFHQSYGYEEFVEGLRPVLVEDSDSHLRSSGATDVKYKLEPGIFKTLCDKAAADRGRKYAIFIDEINRGNISKIFGELISLIEVDKRGKHEVLLAYSKKPFSVPANVDIIGSMNTADRSLALLDTALRRRFKFKALYPDTSETQDPDDEFSAPLRGLMVGAIDVRRMLEQMNKRIELLYDRDHCIGHSYFTDLKYCVDDKDKFDEFKGIFVNNIKPLLEEYFFEDWEKIRLVLGDDQKTSAELRFLNKIQLSDERDLFGGDSEYEKFAQRSRYRWNDEAFNQHQAYVGIYSKT